MKFKNWKWVRNGWVLDNGCGLYQSTVLERMIYRVKNFTGGGKAMYRNANGITNDEQKRIEAQLSAQEFVRASIGHELHDNVNQMLSSVKLYQSLALENEDMRVAFIQKSTDILMKAINEIRNLSHALVGSNLEDDDLLSSLSILVEDLKATQKFEVFFIHENIDESLDARLKLHLYRIVQEQLNNVTKHACATTVQISLKQDKKNILLTITDNGKGFSQRLHRKGIGLNNIALRARVCGGECKIFSKKDKGCRLIITIPLANTKSY